MTDRIDVLLDKLTTVAWGWHPAVRSMVGAIVLVAFVVMVILGDQWGAL